MFRVEEEWIHLNTRIMPQTKWNDDAINRIGSNRVHAPLYLLNVVSSRHYHVRTFHIFLINVSFWLNIFWDFRISLSQFRYQRPSLSEKDHPIEVIRSRYLHIILFIIYLFTRFVSRNLTWLSNSINGTHLSTMFYGACLGQCSK